MIGNLNIFSKKTFMNKNCIFCEIKKKISIIKESKFFFVIRDNYPVTRYHTLFISKRHLASFFLLKKKEIVNLFNLLKNEQKQLIKKDKTIKGFNIGINDGKCAGQTIFHLHVHLIPRRKKDVKNPKGGVRGVIPHKQSY